MVSDLTSLVNLKGLQLQLPIDQLFQVYPFIDFQLYPSQSFLFIDVPVSIIPPIY